MTTRVRFAPSPTGYLHIGGARTALFNFLFARQTEGRFLLRIEDTDLQRSSREMVDGILEGMQWLGLEWDEGPFFQSQRLELYRSVCRRLLASAQAYRCFAPVDQLEREKAQALAKGETWLFPEESRAMDPNEAERRAEANQPHVVRFRVEPNRTIRFKDKVYGPVEVESSQVEDFVILRPDGMPTYHLSVVADDVDMRITHVIRGADHLINTVKHILLYIALGEKPPQYVHLPLILGPDKKRLSKRHGASSVTEFRERGFLPEALRNSLALLGWSPKSNQEIYPGDELIQAFELGRVNKADAVFDLEKILWMNGKYISAAAPEELEEGVKTALQKEGLGCEAYAGEGRQWFLQAIELLKPRMRTLRDFATRGKPYFAEAPDAFEYDPEAVDKFLRPDNPGALAAALGELRLEYAQLRPFDAASTEDSLRRLCERRGLKTGVLIGAVRVGLTGQAVAPGIFEVIELLGQARVVERLGRLESSLVM